MSVERYIDLLLTWNEKINLTAITDRTEIRVKHIEDSLALLPHLKDARTLIDLGSGAGFPGIPIKLERPELQVTLVEATRKKVSFLIKVIAQLELKGIRAVQGRVESKELQQQLGTFDIVTSRATWSLKDFLPIALSYCSPEGRIIAMKGAGWRRECQEASITTQEVVSYQLSDGSQRALIIIINE